VPGLRTAVPDHPVLLRHCPRAWHRDVAGADVRSRRCCRRSARGSRDVALRLRQRSTSDAGVHASSSHYPRAWHRDVAGGDVRTGGCRAISDVACRSLGSADCRSGIEIRCGLRVYSGQCPRAWHEDPAANDDRRPRAPVATVPVRAELSGKGVRALGADRANDLIRPSSADEVDRPPVTEKRVKAPQRRTSGIGLVHADQVRPDALRRNQL
jgi:hypothetical protein